MQEAQRKYESRMAAVSRSEMVEAVDGSVNDSERIRLQLEDMWKYLVNRDGAVMLHGPGGSGKSFILNRFTLLLDQKGIKYQVCASTGVSASLIRSAKTAHAFFGLVKSAAGASFASVLEKIMSDEKKYYKLMASLLSLQVLIIDEVSRLGASVFAHIDLLMQHVRQDTRPFGGVGLLLCGDMFQCTPIDDGWFWATRAFQNIYPLLRPVLLHSNMRFGPDEGEWFNVLSLIRRGIVSPYVSKFLKGLCYPHSKESFLLHVSPRTSTHMPWLFPTNAQVVKWNVECVEEFYHLNPMSVKMTTCLFKKSNKSGVEVEVERIESSMQDVAVGMPVMITSNRYYALNQCANGVRGVVTRLYKDVESCPSDMYDPFSNNVKNVKDRWKILKAVQLAEHLHPTVLAMEVTVDKGGVSVSMTLPMIAHHTSYGDDKVAVGIPFVLCYGLTIDKCQGVSLDAAVIDFDRWFTPSLGRAYVALSRVRSCKKIYLFNFQDSYIQCSKEAIYFVEQLQHLNKEREKGGGHELPIPPFVPYRQLDDSDITSTYSNCIDTESFQYLAVIKAKFHRESVENSPLFSKTLFYDYETAPVSMQEGHQPYFNYLVRYERGKVVENKTWIKGEGDCEDVNLSTFSYVADLVLTDADEYIRVKEEYKNLKTWLKGGGGNAKMKAAYKRKKEVLSAKLTWLKKPFVLCAYNGSGFDFHWLMQYMCSYGGDNAASLEAMREDWSERVQTKTTFKGGRIMICSIYDKKSKKEILQCHDLANIIMCSLDQAVSNFLPKRDGGDDAEAMSKGCFPHFYFARVGKGTVDILSDSPVVLELSDFGMEGSAHRMKAEKKIKAGEMKLEEYYIRKEMKHYGPLDVKVLIEVYRQVDNVCLDVLNTSVVHFVSASALAWHAGLRFIPSTYCFISNQRQKVTQFFCLNYGEETIVRQSVKGGKVFPRITNWETGDKELEYDKIEDYFVYLDFSGMYVRVMKHYQFPYGRHEKVTPELSEKLMNFFNGDRSVWASWWTVPLCILTVTASLHPDEVEPCVPARVWPGADSSDRVGKSIEWKNGRRKDCYTIIDIYLIVRNEGKIHSVHDGIVWPERGRLFEKWMEKTVKEKSAAEVSGKKALRQWWKLLGNSFFGSLLKRDFDSVVQHVYSREEKESFLKTCVWSGLYPCDNGSYIMTGTDESMKFDHWTTSRVPHLGAFVLSYSRLMQDDVYAAINPDRRNPSAVGCVKNQVAYGDTDSFIVHRSCLPRIKQFIKNENGFLTDDLDKGWCMKDGEDITQNDVWSLEDLSFSKITSLICPAPKSYGCEYVQQAKPLTVQSCWKFKGVPKRNISFMYKNELHHVLTFRILHDLMMKMEVLEIRKEILKKSLFQLPKQQVMDGRKPFTIHGEDLIRTLFQTDWCGRKYVAHPLMDKNVGFTVPLDWEGGKKNALFEEARLIDFRLLLKKAREKEEEEVEYCLI